LGKYSLGTFVIQQTNSWLSPFVVNSSDFLSIDPTEVASPRQADGSLPIITYMHLATGSDLIDAGTNVNIPFNGTKPDLGAWETGNYNLNITSNGSGYVILKPVGGIYVPGTTVLATAIPLAGNSFFNWTGNITGTQPGITITMNSNISATANFQIINDINTINNLNKDEISCNPSSVEGYTTLKINLTKAEKLNISVYNISGQKVLDFGEKLFFPGENIQELSMFSLKPGTYLLIADSKTDRKRCKLIKNR
jgi:hypothetical protein